MVKGDRNLFLAQSHLLLEVVFLTVIFHQFTNSNHSDFPFEIIYCLCFLLLCDTIDIHGFGTDFVGLEYDFLVYIQTFVGP